MLDKKLQEYSERFDDSFPMMPLGWGRNEKEIISIIDRCLKEGKDVYELGYVTDDDDGVEYGKSCKC